MRIMSRLLGLQGIAYSTLVHLQNLEAWTRNHVFQAMNVQSAPPAPYPNLAMDIEKVHESSLLSNGGEAELYDYIKAVMDGSIARTDRKVVSDPANWHSEHYLIHPDRNRVELMTVLPVNSKKLPNWKRSHAYDDKAGANYLVGPDGTWFCPPEQGKLGFVSVGDSIALKLRLEYAESSEAGETFAVEMNSYGTCHSSIKATLELGQPIYVLSTLAPLSYVTQEEFDSNLEICLPGSLIDHQERLKERVKKVFTALIPTEDGCPPMTYLTGKFSTDRHNRHNDDTPCVMTASDKTWCDLIHNYADQQLAQVKSSTGFPAYLYIGGTVAIGFTEKSSEFFFGNVWERLTVLQRLDLYVTLLALHQSNHSSDYSAGHIFRSLDTVLA